MKSISYSKDSVYYFIYYIVKGKCPIRAQPAKVRVRGGRQWVQGDNRSVIKDKPKIDIAGFSNPKINDGDNGQGGAPKGFGGPDKRRRRWGDLRFFMRCDCLQEREKEPETA